MSEPDPIGNEVRRARRKRRVGPNAICVLCGFTNPTALQRVDRSVLEAHHPLAAGHVVTVTVPLCRNCHALETERMRDAAIPLTRDDRSVLEVTEAVLRALAIFLRTLADALDGFAQREGLLINDLDEHLPGWRGLERGQPE